MYRLLLSTSSRLPLKVARSLGRGLGYLYYRLGKKRAHIVRVNMDLCYPQLSEAEKEQRTRNSFLEAGQWFMEAGAVWMWPRERILRQVSVVNEDLYRRALAENKGLILAIPHLGNWEVMGPFVTRDTEFACFYKHDEKNPGFSTFLYDQRSRNGTRMASADQKGIRLLYKHLKADHVVGLLPDHNPTDEMGVFAPLFGHPALTGTLISSLARKNGVRVLSAAVIRRAGGFTIHFDEVADQHSDDPVVAATGLNQALERCIALAPEQYQWTYPRFRKRMNPEQQSPYRAARRGG